MTSALEALERLREGNRRFVSGDRRFGASITQKDRSDLIDGQQPFAVVLGCSDSRVPVELIFDQGVGDLFVIRVAGNIVAATQIGSVEFAAEQFGTGLVVVLGHSRCGAIQATLDELRRPTENQSPNLRFIVECIRPSVEDLLATDTDCSGELLAQRAMRANVRAAVNSLQHGSEILEQLIQSERISIVGAEYCIESGVVDFFDGLPDAR